MEITKEMLPRTFDVIDFREKYRSLLKEAIPLMHLAASSVDFNNMVKAEMAFLDIDDTPQGYVKAAESVVDYLRNRFAREEELFLLRRDEENL